MSKFLLKEGCHASCSSGTAICLANEKPTSELIERADQALYRAKRERTGSCLLWEP